MEIAAIHAMLFVEAVINAHVVLAPVERTRLLERSVVGRRRIGVSHPQLLHSAEDRCNSFPVSRQQAGWDHVPCETAGTDRGGLNAPIRVESRGNASTRCVRRISKHSVIRGSNKAVWSPQAKREITQPFRPRRHTPLYRGRILPDALVFLTHKKEELILLDRSVEVPAEIVKAQFRSYRREEIARVEFVVAEKLKRAAVIRVAATARDDINCGSGVAPVFSGKVRSLNFDFLHKVNTDVVDLTVVATRIHVEAAINREAVVVGSIAVHGRLADAQARRECQLILVKDCCARD